MNLFGRLQRERTWARVKDTVTFNGPGTFTFIPQYGKTLFTVAGKGQDGSAGGTTTILGYNTTYNHLYSRVDGTGTDVVSTDGGFTAGRPVPANYCDPITPEDGTVYTSSRLCYDFTAASQTESTSGSDGAGFTAFGVTFPGGVQGPAVAVGETTISLAYAPSGYSVTLPAGASLTIRNKY